MPISRIWGVCTYALLATHLSTKHLRDLDRRQPDSTTGSVDED